MISSDLNQLLLRIETRESDQQFFHIPVPLESLLRSTYLSCVSARRPFSFQSWAASRACFFSNGVSLPVTCFSAFEYLPKNFPDPAGAPDCFFALSIALSAKRTATASLNL